MVLAKTELLRLHVRVHHAPHVLENRINEFHQQIQSSAYERSPSRNARSIGPMAEYRRASLVIPLLVHPLKKSQLDHRLLYLAIAHLGRSGFYSIITYLGSLD